MLNIVKKNKGEFLIFDKRHLGSEVHLDFNPFLEVLKGEIGLILHLRPRPFHVPDHWSYGIYDVRKDEYFSVEHLTTKLVEFRSIKLDKILRPTHVLFFPESSLEISENGKTATIYSLYYDDDKLNRIIPVEPIIASQLGTGTKNRNNAK